MVSASPVQYAELEILNVAHGGVMVGRLDGRVVFVPDAIPGEKVRVEITDDSRPSYWRAELLEVLEPSPFRQRHVWPEADLSRPPALRPGGAEFGHIRLDYQRKLKADVLADSLSRFAGIDRRVEVAGIEGDDGLGWRTRVRLHIDGNGRPGPFAARSHEVVPVSTLPLATGQINRLIDFGESYPGTELEVVQSAAEGAFIVRDSSAQIEEQALGLRFSLPASGFWQVHRRAADELARLVLEMIEESLFEPSANNLDLYGGVGLFAAAVCARLDPEASIRSVESVLESGPFTSRNLERYPNAKSETQRVDRFLKRLLDEGESVDASTVILDPPRKGAGELVIRNLVALNPAQLIYVACDPVALSRDLGLLLPLGYEIAELRALDLFPNTHHFETVASLRKAAG